MTSDERTLDPGSRAARRLFAALSTVLLLGCSGGGEPRTSSDPTSPDLVIAAAVGDTDFFDVTVDLGVAFCSTAVGCPTTLHSETKPSLVTGATCSMANSWDGFLLYARRLACYSGGTLGDPSTWTGESVISAPATTTEERAYSAVITSNDSEFVNSTQYLEPLDSGSPNHCYYEAEALVVPTALDANPREVYHRLHPARMTWDVVIEPTGSSTYDCHFSGSPALSGVDVDYPFSVTVSLPSDTDKGDFPATFDYATIWPTTHDSVGAARVRYVLAATMPVTPTGVPSWTDRDLWVTSSGTTVDTEIDSTCVRVDSSTGALQSIGVLLRDASSGAHLGLVEVLSDDSGTRFDCDREGTYNSCNYIAYTDDPGGESVCGELVMRCHDGAKNYTETGVDCGGDCPGCTVGGSCSVDADCLSGYCDTGACVDATSCLALYTARSSTPSGRYELNPGSGAFMAYCDMSSGDPGWTLVMKLSALETSVHPEDSSDNLTYSAGAWTTSGTLINAANPYPNEEVLTATDAKYAAYDTVAGSALRLDWLGVSTSAWSYTLGTGENTALDVFSGGSNLITGNESVATCNGTLLSSAANYDGSLMHFALGSQFYGFNGSGTGSSTSRIRWGFGSNDETVANPGSGQVWEPQVGIGSTTRSIFWIHETDCDDCSPCYGSGSADYADVAGNLWIK